VLHVVAVKGDRIHYQVLQRGHSISIVRVIAEVRLGFGCCQIHIGRLVSGRAVCLCVGLFDFVKRCPLYLIMPSVICTG
jgi:hypothetical protein